MREAAADRPPDLSLASNGTLANHPVAPAAPAPTTPGLQQARDHLERHNVTDPSDRARMISPGRDGAAVSTDELRKAAELEQAADPAHPMPMGRNEGRAAIEILKNDRGDCENVSGSAAGIAIKEWDPNTPYLAAMKAVSADKAYGVYLEQRKSNAASPAFYLDCADYLLRVGQHEMGVRVLTNIVELKLESAPLLRVAAGRLAQTGLAADRDLAIELYEKVLKMRPEEPQSYRDLALALADRADALLTVSPTGAGLPRVMSDYQRSLELLNKVIMGQWDGRFAEIELPALMEANRLIARLDRLPRDREVSLPLDARLVKLVDLDVRVVLQWDADNTDVDLWVTEPSGEKCVYDHNRTTIGGRDSAASGDLGTNDIIGSDFSSAPTSCRRGSSRQAASNGGFRKQFTEWRLQ